MDIIREIVEYELGRVIVDIKDTVNGFLVLCSDGELFMFADIVMEAKK